MLTGLETIFQPDELRASLHAFWDSALTIEPYRDGWAIAMPQTGADGWQLVLELTTPVPGSLKISDAGRTLLGLAAQGQNIESDSVLGHVETILRQSHMERNGMELFRILAIPLEAVDVHVFAEALAAITHLHILHEPTVRTHDVADETLRRVFADHQIKPRSGAMLSGKTERSIRVDYLVEAAHPVAFQILRRKKGLLPLMEQWGYRWNDFKRVTPTLMPVMLYDPAVQEIDESSRAIGEEVCSLFCAYHETERIHEVLDQANR